MAEFCDDGRGSIDPTKWIACRDDLALSEFLLLEEAQIVARDRAMARDLHLQRNPEALGGDA